MLYLSAVRLILIGFVGSTGAANSAEERSVDANVVTAIDVSGSIESHAERHQLEGLADALEHPAFIEAVRRGPKRSIGFASVTWSSDDDFMLVVPWQRIETTADAHRIAGHLRSLEPARRFPHHSYSMGRRWRSSLETDISGAIEKATSLFIDAPFRSSRQLLNICANGIDNVGHAPDLARDAAVALGVTVNGMILGDQPEVADYFRTHVQGGPGAFVMTVRDRGDIVASMLAKFTLELADDRWVPPSPRPLQVLALTAGF